MLETPHADSDDIRMMPNYFMAYTITNRDIENLTLNGGKIEQMAGWENGIDASKFVNAGRSLGSNEDIEGIYYASALYSGAEDSVLQAWYYNMADISNLFYIEAAREFFTRSSHIVAGLQLDRAVGDGRELLGKIDSFTWGASLQVNFKRLDLAATAAYNKEEGSGGAFGSLGGGPFFTSLEDQTMDAVGTKGRAWVAGLSHDFSGSGAEGLSVEAFYGSFKANKSALYDTTETDLTLTYEISDRLTVTAAYALIDDKTVSDNDYSQFRVVAKYGFFTAPQNRLNR